MRAPGSRGWRTAATLPSGKARGSRAEERAVECEEAVRRAGHVLLPVLRRIVVGASGSITQHENNSHLRHLAQDSACFELCDFDLAFIVTRVEV